MRVYGECPRVISSGPVCKLQCVCVCVCIIIMYVYILYMRVYGNVPG